MVKPDSPHTAVSDHAFLFAEGSVGVRDIRVAGSVGVGDVSAGSVLETLVYIGSVGVGDISAGSVGVGRR